MNPSALFSVGRRFRLISGILIAWLVFASAASAVFADVLDTTGPTVTIDPPSVAVTGSGPVSFLVTYTDPNFDSSSVTLLADQVIVNKPLSVHIGSILVFGSGNTRTVQISGLRGDGLLGIAIPANTAADLAGNPSQASLPSANAVVDNTPPTVTVSGPSVPATGSGPVSFTVSYADANLDSSSIALSSTQVTLNTAGTVHVGSVNVSGTGTTRDVVLSAITGNGALGISVANGTASDLAGNLALATGPSDTATIQNPNQPPAFDGYTIHTLQNTASSVGVAKILARAHDPDLDPVTITGVSAGSLQGGIVAMNGSTVQYTPAGGYVGNDSFSITLSDGLLTSSGQIDVVIGSGPGNGSAIVSVTSNGPDIALKFVGVPGTPYDLQRSTSLTAPVVWTTLATLTPNSSGFILYTDSSPPNPSYWRSITH